MSEWATAFGLGLKRTIGQFAPRDGKPREPKQGPGRGNGGREQPPSDSPFAVLAPLKAQLTGHKH